MSTLITISVSGGSDKDTLTIVHTIRQALRDAELNVWDGIDVPSIAMTTLYEQQVQLAMAGVRCVVEANPIDTGLTSV